MSHYPERCSKCGYTAPNEEWMEITWISNNHYRREALHCECCRCGYSLEMPTVDAGRSEPLEKG